MDVGMRAGVMNEHDANTAGVDRTLVGFLDALKQASPPSDRSDAYRRGFAMGLRFARICVLDEIAANSGSFIQASLNGGPRPQRECARTRAALRRIAERLTDEFVLGADDHAAGYRDATAVVLERIADTQEQIAG
ncbi:hypothetical protein [Mycolicibacterium celeriflavum]|uniref:hypothetical protein n=1 Tax=Mycolicibacterium celeriflavum TaxID=1249101 RepID=UPI003CF19BEE